MRGLVHGGMWWWLLAACGAGGLGCRTGPSSAAYEVRVAAVEVSADRDGVAWDPDGTPPDLVASLACDRQSPARSFIQEGTSVTFERGQVCRFYGREALLAAHLTLDVWDVDLEAHQDILAPTVVRVGAQELAAGSKHVEALGLMEGVDLEFVQNGDWVTVTAGHVVVATTNHGQPWDEDGSGPDLVVQLDCGGGPAGQPLDGTPWDGGVASCFMATSSLLTDGVVVTLVDDDSASPVAVDVPIPLDEGALDAGVVEVSGSGLLRRVKVQVLGVSDATG